MNKMNLSHDEVITWARQRAKSLTDEEINIHRPSGGFSYAGIALLSELRLKAPMWSATYIYLWFPVNGSSNSNCNCSAIWSSFN